METLVVGILTAVVIIAVILVIRLFVAARQAELAKAQNVLMREQVAAQNRTAAIGEQMMAEQGEDDDPVLATPAPAAHAPIAGGEGAIMAGAVGQRPPSARALAAEAEVARLKAELEEKNKDPVLASYEADLKASQTDLEVASMEFAGVRTDARSAELVLKSAKGRRKTVKAKDLAERMDEELEELYGPQLRARTEAPAAESVTAAEPVVAAPATPVVATPEAPTTPVTTPLDEDNGEGDVPESHDPVNLR